MKIQTPPGAGKSKWRWFSWLWRGFSTSWKTWRMRYYYWDGTQRMIAISGAIVGVFAVLVAGFLLIDWGLRRISSFQEIESGKHFVEQKDYATAEACFAEAYRLFPQSVPSLHYRGRIYIERVCAGSTDGTLSDEEFLDLGVRLLSRAIELEHCRTLPWIVPKMGNGIAASYYWRGRARAHRGELESAIDDFSHAIRVDPEMAEAYLHRGKAFFKQEKLELAATDFERAIQYDRTLAEGLASRVKLFQKKENLDGIISDCTRLIMESSPPADSLLMGEAFLERGDAYVLQGKLDSAMTDYEKAIEFHPKYGAALRRRQLVERLRANPVGETETRQQLSDMVQNQP